MPQFFSSIEECLLVAILIVTVSTTPVIRLQLAHKEFFLNFRSDKGWEEVKGEDNLYCCDSSFSPTRHDGNEQEQSCESVDVQSW